MGVILKQIVKKLWFCASVDWISTLWLHRVTACLQEFSQSLKNIDLFTQVKFVVLDSTLIDYIIWYLQPSKRDYELGTDYGCFFLKKISDTKYTTTWNIIKLCNPLAHKHSNLSQPHIAVSHSLTRTHTHTHTHTHTLVTRFKDKSWWLTTSDINTFKNTEQPDSETKIQPTYKQARNNIYSALRKYSFCYITFCYVAALC